MSAEREAVSALTGNVVRFMVRCTPPASPDFMETPLSSARYYQIVEEYSTLRTSPITRTRREMRYRPYPPVCRRKLHFEQMIIKKLQPMKLPFDKCVPNGGPEGADAPDEKEQPIDKCVLKGEPEGTDASEKKELPIEKCVPKSRSEGADAPEKQELPNDKYVPKGGRRLLRFPKRKNHLSTSASPRGGSEGADAPEEKFTIDKCIPKGGRRLLRFPKRTK